MFKLFWRPGKRRFPCRRRLRLVGETKLFWRWREEGGFPLLYRSIEDALDPAGAFNEKYSLRLAGQGENFPRNAFFKISGNGVFAGRRIRFSVPVKKNNLRIGRGGAVVAEVGIYFQKPGRSPADAFDAPDQTIALKISAGTGAWEEISRSFNMPANAALALVRLGATGFFGEVSFGTPKITSGVSSSEIPPLEPPNPYRLNYNWLGENLSRKEWPEFEIRLNNKLVCRKAFFNAIFRRPEFEVELPAIDADDVEIEIKLVADYSSAPCFEVQSVEILEESARGFEILSYPEYAVENASFPLLLEINKPDTELNIAVCGNVIPSENILRFKETGLQVVNFKTGQASGGAKIKFSDGKREESIRIRQIVRRRDDGLRFSTGDAVYIPQTTEHFGRYLEWYLRNRLGNALCFRPVYRWSGSRVVAVGAWKYILPLLEKLGLYYSLMVDGRELPGKNANPPDSILKGAYYLGRQAHEQDGAFCYWGGRLVQEPFTDILARSKDNGGIYPAVRPVRSSEGDFVYFDPSHAGDMRAAAAYFVENLKKGKGHSTRHTGPSTLFRYFYQAGYDWLGAEQMYGPEEVILASLRGAARTYGRKSFGAHLAMQWSSGPHDTPEHAARYFLSLATCYLQGVEHINTEEGLWRVEADHASFDRFSRNCARHRQAHEKFRRFVESHERRGAMRVPIGIIQGRHDGWRCFGRRNVWGHIGKEWEFGAAEKSFDLLKVFYPRSALDGIYRFPCPKKPQGWYSGTPFGPVDLFPIEAPLKVLESYRAAVFLGWNTFMEADFRRLLNYVEGGGTLLLARPHLSTQLKRGVSVSLPVSETIKKLLGTGFDRAHHVIRRRVGRGTVVYFPEDKYPSDPSLRQSYENEFKKIGQAAVAAEEEKGWAHGSADVNFAVYDWEDGKTRAIYLLNVDWWSATKSRPAEILIGDKKYPVKARRGEIEVITVSGAIAVLSLSADCDVLRIEEKTDEVIIEVQTARPVAVMVFGVKPKPVKINVRQVGVSKIRISKDN